MIRYLFLIPSAVLFLSLSSSAQQPGPGPASQTPVATPAVIPPGPTALVRCDKSMGEVQTMASKIDECSKSLAGERAALSAAANSKPNAEPRGLPDTRTTQIPEDISTPAAKELLALAAPLALRGFLNDYFAYTAFANGNSDACKRLAAIDAERPCRDTYAGLNDAHAIVGETWELVKACRQPENSTPPACCTILAKLKDRSNPCALMVPGCFKEMASCKAFWGRADGDAKACASRVVEMKDECKADGCRAEHIMRVARCEADAAFVRAFKAKDINQCGGSQRCRVLMGQGKEVAAEIAAKSLQNPGGNWFVKGGWKTPPPAPAPEATPAAGAPRKATLDYLGFTCAEPLQSTDNRKVVANVISVAKTCLTDIEAAIGTPSRALTEGIDEREEKLARLTVQMELALAVSAPHASPSKPAPAPAKRVR